MYKFIGNKILTKFQNFILNKNFTEYHSGYRAYCISSIKTLPFIKNSNGFHFDTEIIIQLIEAKFTILEVPIPTYYGTEICYVNGIQYAWNVFKATIKYSLHKKGLVYDPRFDLELGEKYTFKKNRFSSHQQILNLLSSRQQKKFIERILDVGCGSGEFAAKLSGAGYKITGVDIYDSPNARNNCNEFIVANVEHDLNVIKDRRFDCIIFADVLEHVRNPEKILLDAREKLIDNGIVIASTGNIAHIYIRLMLLFGKFIYTERGILDRTHVHLFTKSSFQELFKQCSYRINRIKYCPIPFENIVPGKKKLTDALSYINMLLVRLMPGLFAYQIILEAEPNQDNPSELLREVQINQDYVDNNIINQNQSNSEIAINSR